MIMLFDRDAWHEILLTLEKNPLRTLLTAFGVFWGMFMLVLLLGGGQGLKTGAFHGFGDFATNSIIIWPERTTIPYKGLPRNRQYTFTTEDVAAIRDRVEGIKCLVPQKWWGPALMRGTRKLNNPACGTLPEILQIAPVDVPQGRFVNHVDIQQKRKVTVIGKSVYLALFENNENPVGQYIRIHGAEYQVVGVFHSRREGRAAEQQNASIYLPLSTMQQAFNLGNRIQYLIIEAETGFSATKIGEEIKAILRERHQIAPADSLAIDGQNIEGEFLKLKYLFASIAALVWIVGIGTLFSGIIGVSNIMLFTVKARTHELGIRRVLGATPGAVIIQILMESFLLTASAGVLGLCCAVLVLSRLYGIETPTFRNPEISVTVALSSLGIIIASGLAAGLLPALRAVSLKPVEALRDIT